MPSLVRPAALLGLVLGAACAEPAPGGADAGADAAVSAADAGDGGPANTDGGSSTDAGQTESCEADAGLLVCDADAGVTFAHVQDVLERRCVVCHKPGAKIFGGVLLTSDVSYSNLVLAPSSCDPVIMRVQPGRPEQSMLWLKVADRACGCGRFRSMPPGTSGLLATRDDFCTIDTWIRSGALGN